MQRERRQQMLASFKSSLNQAESTTTAQIASLSMTRYQRLRDLLRQISHSRIVGFYNVPAVCALLRLSSSVVQTVVSTAVIFQFLEGENFHAWHEDGEQVRRHTPLHTCAWLVSGRAPLARVARGREGANSPGTLRACGLHLTEPDLTQRDPY